jgi:toxin FitB
VEAAVRALLDTSVVIGGLDDETTLPPAAAISVITLGELRAGVRLAADAGVRAARQRRLNAIRAAFEPLVVDEDVAEHYGEVLTAARASGRSAKATDLLIIATAGATGRALHTLDTRQAALADIAGIAVLAPP